MFDDLDEIDAQLDAVSAMDLPGTASAAAMAGPRAPPPAGRTVWVGDFQAEARTPSDRTRVPFLPAPRGAWFPAQAQGTLQALRWMMQKSALRHDMFLLGEPGPELRQLVVLYCVLLGKELEYVAITRDTTEADLKQRREIVGGDLRYVDQPPVSAAKHGRVLLLEGIEKAERNVLPTLNNLLENREMALEDRTFLAAPSRAGDLGGVEGHIPVSEHFEVIAIGQPNRGNPLDPPLRSRFVAFEIRPRGLRGTAGEELKRLAQCTVGSNDPPLAALRQLVSLAELLAAVRGDSGPREVASEAELPSPLPDVSLGGLARLLGLLPNCSLREVLLRAYPIHLQGLTEARLVATEKALGACGFGRGAAGASAYTDVWRLSPVTADQPACVIEFTAEGAAGTSMSAKTPCSPRFSLEAEVDRPLVRPIGGVTLTRTQRQYVAAMLQDHTVGVDICLVGERGVGKSVLVRAFCELLGYQPHVVFCYQDMVSRDLLQRRTTDSFGNTTWQNSPLLTAAMHGEVAVLDGVHRLAKGMLYSAVGRLLHDREVDLADGARLVSPEHFERLLADGYTPEDLAGRRIGRVHPSFRVVAAAEPSASAGKDAWLTAEACTLFHFHEVAPLPPMELRELCLVGEAAGVEARARRQRAFDGLISFGSTVRQQVEKSEENKELGAMAMSLRQLKRAGQHLTASHGDAAGAADRAFSARLHFLQPDTQHKVNELLGAAMRSAGAGAMRKLRRPGLEASHTSGGEPLSVCSGERELRIGGVACPVKDPARPELVPDVEFVDTPQHLAALQNMLLDWTLGHHLLLVGNQGTGKNKLTDRLLQLLRYEREYVQLHRDTTVQSLLLAQSLEAGVVMREDSAVVRAVRNGHCLVVDEGDKAPLEVVCVLKALADDGELTLGDGRCIVRRGDPRLGRARAEGGGEEQLIETGEGFRLIVLANRPGFPFLGNDFFRVCGDVFSCHVVDNPNVTSELALITAYGPSVPRGQLEKLAGLFSELRDMADGGLLTYPYSTRELVKAVRHLNAFPGDPLERVLGDVFAFDLVDRGKGEVILRVLQRHGIGATPEARDLLYGRPQGLVEIEVEESDGEDGDDDDHAGPGGADE